MPWTLYRMMMVDLLRVIGLTAAVLVTVIAFGATIKPLTGDTLLDAGQIVRYLLLAIVPMLQFALPFAAGFGATLALHRMAVDNEVQAMAASGLSYRRILTPVLALGAALLVIMVALTQEVIPRFWSLIEQMIARDVTRVFEASIRRGEPFTLGDMQIYADDIIVQRSPEGAAGPETRLQLAKVAAAELDDFGRIVTDVTASRAVVDIYRLKGETLLKLAMYDAVAYRSATGDLAHLEQFKPSRAIAIPGVLRDNPKAKSRSELLELRRDPDRFGQVVEARQALADTVREIEARQSLDSQLRNSGQVTLLAPDLSGERRSRRYVVNADRLAEGQFVTRDGRRIEVIQSDGDLALRRFITDSAMLTPTSGTRLGTPSFDLALGRYEVTDLRPGGGTNQRESFSVPNLSVASTSDEDLLELPSDELENRARSVRASRERLQPRITKLRNEIDSLQREITSRLLNRYALSVTAPLLLLLGAVLAMWLRSSLPLTIYLLAFVPAVVDLILISAGEQLMRDGRAIGPIIMWSGNALMLVVIALAYLRLSRN